MCVCSVRVYNVAVGMHFCEICKWNDNEHCYFCCSMLYLVERFSAAIVLFHSYLGSTKQIAPDYVKALKIKFIKPQNCGFKSVAIIYILYGMNQK